MQIELVSFALCPFVQRVGTMLHEKGAPFSIRYIDLRNKPDWFLAMSPLGRVPVMVADGRSLFESLAILEFIDETIEPGRDESALLSADPFERARQRAFMSFAGDVFTAHYKVTIATTDEDLESTTMALRRGLAIFEAALGAGDWFAGERFGLVDVAMAPALQRLLFLEAKTGRDLIGDLARVKAWARRLAAYPSVQRALPPDFERLFLDSLRENGSALGRSLAA